MTDDYVRHDSINNSNGGADENSERIDELLEEAGGVGRFQCLSYFVVSCFISSISFIWYGIPLYTKQPDYFCTWNGQAPEQADSVCVAENICASDPRIGSWSIDWSSKTSIHNWQQDFDMMCIPKVKIGLIGSVWFVGWVLTLPFIPRLADIYGRSKLVRIAAVSDLVLFVALGFCNSFRMMLVLSLCFGLLTSIRVNIGFIYMMEMLPKRSQAVLGSIWCAFEASIMLLASLYFIFD